MAYNSTWNDISHMNYICKHIYCFDFCKKAKSRDFHRRGAFVSNFSKMAPWHKMKGKTFFIHHSDILSFKKSKKYFHDVCFGFRVKFLKNGANDIKWRERLFFIHLSDILSVKKCFHDVCFSFRVKFLKNGAMT